MHSRGAAPRLPTASASAQLQGEGAPPPAGIATRANEVVWYADVGPCSKNILSPALRREVHERALRAGGHVLGAQLKYAANITSTLYTRDFEHLHVELMA